MFRSDQSLVYPPAIEVNDFETPAVLIEAFANGYIIRSSKLLNSSNSHSPVMNHLAQENARCPDTGLVGGKKLT
ncbi:hypothetical protein, partial [Sinorhizobium meliloti]|uniref:hypothetical protein n=1 Tax=Rhizobium meliloti TaxID=382 RepID=UPI001AECAEF9